jgi:CubicO group peptidase (beta-lactamase class C family)
MLLRFFFFVALSSPAFAANLDGLDQKIDVFVKKYQTVPDMGVAVGVVQGNQLIYFRGFGYRDRTAKLPVTSKTLFRIGSNTKSFLSTSLNMLAEEGKLNLEAPVRTVLRDFQLEDPGVSSQATFVDLLSHRTGLPRHDVLWYATPFTRERLFSSLRYLEMNKNPGYGFRQIWQYNNLMFMTLGMVGEKVSGLTWQDLVTEKVLNPLNMDSTVFSTAEMLESNDFANGYFKLSNAGNGEYENIGPAGVLVSNSEDLAKWIGLFLNQGRGPDGRTLISKSQMERMWTVESFEDSSTLNVKIQYGLGWFIDSVSGHRMIYHGGNIDGFSTYISYLPEDNLGLIILVNQNAAASFEFPWQFGEVTGLPLVIYKHLLDDNTAPSKRSVSLAFAQSLVNQKTLAVQDRSMMRALSSMTLYTVLGDFSERAYGDIQLAKDDEDNLHLLYYGHDWTLTRTADNQYSLTIDPDQDPIAVTIEGPYDQITAINVGFETSVKPIRFVKPPLF